jgi:hypothetical protein
MAKVTSDEREKTPITRERLAELLNEDLPREYQAIRLRARKMPENPRPVGH